MDYTGQPPSTYDDFKHSAKGNPLKFAFPGDYLSSVESNAAVFCSLAVTEIGAAPVLIILLLAFDGLVAVWMPLLLIIWNVIFFSITISFLWI